MSCFLPTQHLFNWECPLSYIQFLVATKEGHSLSTQPDSILGRMPEGSEGPSAESQPTGQIVNEGVQHPV